MAMRKVSLFIAQLNCSVHIRIVDLTTLKLLFVGLSL